MYKFRAWDKKNKIMFAVHELKFAEDRGKAGNVEMIRGYSSVGCTSFEGKDVFGGYNMKRLELMLWSGLRDYYAGDILDMACSWDIDRKGVIVFADGAFYVENVKNRSDRELLSNIIELYENPKVIGNIYDNPDLLKAGERS